MCETRAAVERRGEGAADPPATLPGRSSGWDLEGDAGPARRRSARSAGRSRLARSRIRVKPKCPSPGPPTSPTEKPAPSSSIARVRRSPSIWSAPRPCSAPAWRCTLATASVRTRNDRGRLGREVEHRPGGPYDRWQPLPAACADVFDGGLDPAHRHRDREVLQPGTYDPVSCRHRFPQPLDARPRELRRDGSPAPPARACKCEVLREPVVDLCCQPHTLALDLGGLQLLS